MIEFIPIHTNGWHQRRHEFVDVKERSIRQLFKLYPWEFLMREEFGPRDITDLALPFFCVTSNLTVGRAQAHRDGPLWFWLRASCRTCKES